MELLKHLASAESAALERQLRKRDMLCRIAKAKKDPPEEKLSSPANSAPPPVLLQPLAHSTPQPPRATAAPTTVGFYSRPAANVPTRSELQPA
eukprot:2763212-Pleurochrysis_carterae.AAC.2